jgi:hypothetical protein
MRIMAAKARLQDIIDALEIQFDEMPSFLELETGEVHTVHSELLRDAKIYKDDEEPDLPEWQDDEWEVAKRIAFNFPVEFKRLPTKGEVDEWSIMEEFSQQVSAGRIREELVDAIHGTGAFRHFKSVINRQGMESAWYTFRAGALRQIAIDWCEENGVQWE